MAGLFDDLIPQAQSGGGLDPRARDLAIRTIYGEAANEPEEGQAAVAHVIRNRAQAGRYGGSDVPSVVMARNQFEPWNGGPARDRMLALDPNSPAYQRIGAIVDNVWGGKMPDPTGGMTHFFAPKAQAALGRQPPKWGRTGGLPIGNHTFFAPEGRVGAAGVPLNIQSPVAQQAAASGGLFDDLIPKEGTAPVTPVESAPLPPPITATDMGGYSPEQVKAVTEQQNKTNDIGRTAAAVRGAYSGATANFSDELEGVRAAGGFSGVPHLGPLDPRYVTGLASLGLDYLTGRKGQATQRYEAARDQTRSDLAQAQEQYPGTTLAGQVGGAVVLPGGAFIQGATLPARMGRSAIVGATYGGMAGAGEGTTAEDRATRAASGAAIGAGVGAVAPPLLSGAGAVAGAIWRPIASTVRGLVNPEAEAGRRVVSALSRDMQLPGGAQHAAQMQVAGRQGAPVANLDLGGETTRALARSAANTSTEGRAALQSLADARFEGQGDRATQFIRNLVGPVDSQGTRDALRTAAQNVNRPAYERAYRAPNAQVLWDEGFEQLMQAPVVQEAARAATRTGANRAAADGYTPIRNPFVWDDQGRWTLAGNARPNLQFWDHVKRNLDDTITRLQRAGENSAARDAQQLRSMLIQRLDQAVPEFQAARAGAARFFGAENALEAGENFVRSGMTAAEGARAIARMSVPERELFRQGFAARLIDDINATRDRVNVLNKIGQSAEARNKLRVALGPQGYRNVEAFLTVEQAMDRLRGALGNSTTARQLAEIGLAGGAGYGLSGGDITTGGAAALAAFLTRRAGARIDERVARRVAEMLTSSDPQVLARGVRMAAQNQNIVSALRSLDHRLSRISGQQGTQVPVIQSVVPGRADDDQPKAPRPPGQ